MRELIAKYPLATLISSSISHLPLVLEGDKLVGHMARANPHWQGLDGAPVTAIFHGPDAFITPTWYPEDDVPTWNYAVVHVTGTCHLVQDYEGILTSVRLLSERMDLKWKFWVPDDLNSEKKIEGSIVAFEIADLKWNAKFKLSQHRPVEERQSVIRGLRERGGPKDLELAQLMER